MTPGERTFLKERISQIVRQREVNGGTCQDCGGDLPESGANHVKRKYCSRKCSERGSYWNRVVA